MKNQPQFRFELLILFNFAIKHILWPYILCVLQSFKYYVIQLDLSFFDKQEKSFEHRLCFYVILFD